MGTQQRLAVCGYGRFGAALCELAIERGYVVAAYDPIAEVPAALRVPSLARLCESARDILLCVPLEHFEESLKRIRPLLGAEHLVLDVGSVKLEPVQAMRQELEGASHWIGTHPLFGPTSLARGERPLRVVLCEGSSGSLQRARALWEALGCECLEQSAEEHDRAMAGSHALAFFLAKGLLEIRAGEGAAFTPPSFEAIGKTITAVRSDAGHLFRSIQNRNPFAAEERASLIEALRRIDDQLSRPETQASSTETEIPGLEETAPGEDSTPAILSELDQELVALLARRALLRSRVSTADRAAEDAQLTEAAKRLHLSPERIEALTRLLQED